MANISKTMLELLDCFIAFLFLFTIVFVGFGAN